MTTREEVVRKLTELADTIMLAKGKDYTAGKWESDPNYNFNQIAELLKGAPITPYTVCMIYFLKHVFSLIKYCKTGTQEGGEGLEGRHVDALNYARILWSLVVEAEERTAERVENRSEAETAKIAEEVLNRYYADPDEEVEKEIANLEHVGEPWAYKDTCSCAACLRARAKKRTQEAIQSYLADPDEVNRIVGDLSLNTEEFESLPDCQCPSCRRVRERRKQMALDEQYRLSKGSQNK